MAAAIILNLMSSAGLATGSNPDFLVRWEPEADTYYVGEQRPLTFRITDASGADVALPSAVVITVSQPDGTDATPPAMVAASAAQSQQTVSALFTFAQAGVHVVTVAATVGGEIVDARVALAISS